MSCKRIDCAVKSTNTDTCDYILITGRRRGCPAGALCTRYKHVNARGRKVPQLPSTFNPKEKSGLYTAFMSLYEEGFSDPQIAVALGVGKETVARWRRGEQLPNRETRRQIMAAHEKASVILSEAKNPVNRTEAPK